MLEAEVVRLDPSDPTRRLSKNYRFVLEIFLAALPAMAIGYLLAFLDPNRRFQHYLAHQIGIALDVLVSGFAASLAWRCYIHNGKPLLRWGAVGLAGCSPIGVLHRLVIS